jgi:hypothetical protein
MDPLTHIALGASLGYAGFGRRLGRHAATAGGLAAFAPDADIFISSATDPLLAIEYHRGFTHAVAFAPVGAAVVAATATAATTDTAVGAAKAANASACAFAAAVAARAGQEVKIRPNPSVPWLNAAARGCGVCPQRRRSKY